MELWFDVGIKRYTTTYLKHKQHEGCGLMQESKDIQPGGRVVNPHKSCGLMQESKDIQLLANEQSQQDSCGLMQESKDIQPINIEHILSIVVV